MRVFVKKSLLFALTPFILSFISVGYASSGSFTVNMSTEAGQWCSTKEKPTAYRWIFQLVGCQTGACETPVDLTTAGSVSSFGPFFSYAGTKSATINLATISSKNYQYVGIVGQRFPGSIPCTSSETLVASEYSPIANTVVPNKSFAFFLNQCATNLSNTITIAVKKEGGVWVPTENSNLSNTPPANCSS